MEFLQEREHLWRDCEHLIGCAQIKENSVGPKYCVKPILRVVPSLAITPEETPLKPIRAPGKSVMKRKKKCNFSNERIELTPEETPLKPIRAPEKSVMKRKKKCDFSNERIERQLERTRPCGCVSHMVLNETLPSLAKVQSPSRTATKIFQSNTSSPKRMPKVKTMPQLHATMGATAWLPTSSTSKLALEAELPSPPVLPLQFRNSVAVMNQSTPTFKRFQHSPKRFKAQTVRTSPVRTQPVMGSQPKQMKLPLISKLGAVERQIGKMEDATISTVQQNSFNTSTSATQLVQSSLHLSKGSSARRLAQSKKRKPKINLNPAILKQVMPDASPLDAVLNNNPKVVRQGQHLPTIISKKDLVKDKKRYLRIQAKIKLIKKEFAEDFEQTGAGPTNRSRSLNTSRLLQGRAAAEPTAVRQQSVKARNFNPQVSQIMRTIKQSAKQQHSGRQSEELISKQELYQKARETLLKCESLNQFEKKFGETTLFSQRAVAADSGDKQLTRTPSIQKMKHSQSTFLKKIMVDETDRTSTDKSMIVNSNQMMSRKPSQLDTETIQNILKNRRSTLNTNTNLLQFP